MDDNSKKKIAIITVGELPVPTVKGGGAEILIEHLLDENEKKPKYEFVVYGVEDKGALEKSKKYKYAKFVFLKRAKHSLVERLKRKLIYLYSGFSIPLKQIDYYRVIKDIKEQKVDYVIIENTMVPFAKYAKSFGEKLILHTHWDYINIDLPQIVLNRYKKAALKCGKIITVSEYIKKRILTVPEIESERVAVLKNCTDMKKFSVEVSEEDRKKRRSSYGISDEDTVFVFSGRLSKEKGVIELANAFALSEKNNKNIKLLIVGSPQTGKTITNDYTEKVYSVLNKCKDKVIYTGYVDHDDMPYIYNMADVALLPSTGQDPAPLTIFEAMASGLPIITTYSGGIPEYATEECADLVRIDDFIVESLSNQINKYAESKELQERKGKASKKRSNLFDKEKYFEDFCEILDNI